MKYSLLRERSGRELLEFIKYPVDYTNNEWKLNVQK